MKHSSEECSLHTRTLSVFGGSTSRSFLNEVCLRLWSFSNLYKLNPFLSASLLEQSYVILTIYHCKQDSPQKHAPCVEDETTVCHWFHRHLAYQPSCCWTCDVIDRCVPWWQLPGPRCTCTAVTWYTDLNSIYSLGGKVNMDNQHSMDISCSIWILL